MSIRSSIKSCSTSQYLSDDRRSLSVFSAWSLSSIGSDHNAAERLLDFCRLRLDFDVRERVRLGRRAPILSKEFNIILAEKLWESSEYLSGGPDNLEIVVRYGLYCAPSTSGVRTRTTIKGGFAFCPDKRLLFRIKKTVDHDRVALSRTLPGLPRSFAIPLRPVHCVRPETALMS
jgi:hypothetical protein